MRIKVKGNLSGAVTAIKGQEITVTAEQGADLIERCLAVEVAAPAEPKKPKAAANRAKKA